MSVCVFVGQLAGLSISRITQFIIIEYFFSLCLTCETTCEIGGSNMWLVSMSQYKRGLGLVEVCTLLSAIVVFKWINSAFFHVWESQSSVSVSFGQLFGNMGMVQVLCRTPN